MYPSEAENSKYATHNTSTTESTTGMHQDMPLILNNNHAFSVTDELTKSTWHYKQRQKDAHFVQTVNLYC